MTRQQRRICAPLLSPSSQRRAISALLIVALASPPWVSAWAQPSQAPPSFDSLTPEQQSEFASLIELAVNNEKRDHYSKSLQYYQEAFKILPHPKLYYSMAVCYERLGDSANALKYYKMFVQQQPQAQEAPGAEQRIAELSQAMVRQETSLRVDSSPPGAAVFLEDITRGPVGSTPTTDLPVNSGTYRVIIRLDGYEELVETVQVKPGERANVRFTLKKLPGLEDPGVSKRASSGSATPWVLLGVGVLATGGAITFGVLDANMEEEFKGPERFRYNEDEWRRKQTYEVMTYVSAAAAILSFTGAILLWATDEGGQRRGMFSPGPSDRATVSWPTVWAVPDGAGLGIQGRF